MDPGAPSALRCTRCGAEVAGTRHTRNGYIVGYYLLHGGRTAEATYRRRDDEAPIAYRRLVEPLEVVSCAACLHAPEVERRWQSFGDEA